MEKMSLREIQLAELDLMVEFDKVMRKYGLKYTLCAGTLLGAVRHKGFIPWDDDIDVSMPRPDYQKLIRLNRKKKLWPENMELKCFEDGTLDAPFMKLFDTNTQITETNYSQKDVKNLWIDIFPVDGLPKDKTSRKLHYKLAKDFCRMNVASVVNDDYGSNKAVIFIKKHFMKPLAKRFGRKNISEMQRKLALSYPYKDSKYCGMVTWAYDGPGQTLTRKQYERLIELPFEGHSFYATASYDKYLRGVFGDYMQLPPEEERITHDLEAYRL